MAEGTPLNLRGLGAGFVMGRAAKNQTSVDASIAKLQAQIDRLTAALGQADGAVRASNSRRSGGGNGGAQSQRPNGGVEGGSHLPSSHRADEPARIFGGGPQEPGRRSNGGGATFGGQSGSTGGAHAAPAPTMAQRANTAVAAAGGPVGAAAVGVGAAYVTSKMVGNQFDKFNENHGSGMVLNQAIASQYSYTAKGWKDTYAGLFSNHYAATSSADLSQAQGIFAARSGLSVGSDQYRKAFSSAAATSVIDPSISNSQAAQAAVSLGSTTTFNRMQSQGIRTMNRNGQVDVAAIAKQLLDKIPGARSIKTTRQIDAAFGPSGGISLTLQSFVTNGLIPPDAVDVVAAQVRGLLKAQVAGMSDSEFGILTRTAESNSGNAKGDYARDKLNAIGVDTSQIANQRAKEGLGRDGEAETVGGFISGLDTATDALKKFQEGLNQILEIPGVGEIAGFGPGLKGGGLGLSNIPGGSFVSGIMKNLSPGFAGDGPGNMASGAAMYGGAVKAGAGSAKGATFGMSPSGGSSSATSSGGSSGAAAPSTSSYSLGAVKPWVSKAAEVLGGKFGIKTIGGYRSSSAVAGSDHPKGLALDFMCSTSQGNALAPYAMANAAALNISYVIWQQKIWSVNNPSWKAMEDRGSPTANHMDHVHVSFLASPTNADMGGLGAGNGSYSAQSADNGTGSSSPNNGSSFVAAVSSAGGGVGGYSEVGALGLGGGGAGGGVVGASSSGAASGVAASGSSAGLPSGTRVGSANLDWSRGGDDKQLAHLASKYDVLMLQEANKTDLSKVLPKGWMSNQDTTNSGTMGSAIAWNADKLGTSIGTSGLAFGSNQKDANTRYISFVDTTIDGQPVRMISGHAPLKKFADPKVFEENLKKVIGERPKGSEWVVGMDGNSIWKGLGKRLDGVQVGAGVTGQIRSKGLQSANVNIDNFGQASGLTDHRYTGQTLSGDPSKATTAAAAGNGGSPDQNRALGRQMASARGWGSQWDALNALWTRESGWRTTADNPSSSAYGIPQSLPGSKMSAAGKDWATNPATQIEWGLDYIKQRYGDPAKALAHSNKTGWYAAGEWNIRDDQPARVHKGEMILPYKVAEEVRNALTAPNGMRNTGAGITFMPGSVVVQLGAGSKVTKKDARDAGAWVVDAIVKDARIKELVNG